MICVPLWVIRSLYGSSGPFMGHQNVSVHMSHQKAFKAVPLWVIRFVNAIGCTTYDYVTNLIMEMMLYKYMNLF
ncbi:hypothetical protein LOK49_LG01G04277 [Camellia lanceoleosa]|uniref:Uncharacterized protein n=1 Tax=Camellia lanceoleosa TaxID=1840588 RepID=A0ACC0J1N3_9ERIC|nr:hypothetical protein LOK49_LG01G04277 [Camellia lanceoleosa]